MKRASDLGQIRQALPLIPATVGAVGMAVILIFLQPCLGEWPAFTSLIVKVILGAAVYLGSVLAFEWRTAVRFAGPHLRLPMQKV